MSLQPTWPGKNLKITEQTFQVAEDKQVTDRFSKAVEMLANEKLEIRLGGIYLLERIARDSKEDHPVVMEVLTAFVRDRAGKTEDVQGMEEEMAVKPDQDIQSALTVIGRRNIKNDQQPINLAGANLQGVDLTEALLEGANLRYAHLEGANLRYAHLKCANLQGAYLEGISLIRANLERVDLTEANLEQADLMEANLEQADLIEAHLERADLIRAHLEDADLMKADLAEADLRGTNLKRAYLGEANLKRANLQGAHLEGADLKEAHLEGAENITEVQLSQAKLCCTKLPKGINNLDPNRDCEELGLSPPQADEI